MLASCNNKGQAWKSLLKVLGPRCNFGRRFIGSQTHGKKNIVGLTKEELRSEFKHIDLEAFRADQGIRFITGCIFL